MDAENRRKSQGVRVITSIRTSLAPFVFHLESTCNLESYTRGIAACHAFGKSSMAFPKGKSRVSFEGMLVTVVTRICAKPNVVALSNGERNPPQRMGKVSLLYPTSKNIEGCQMHCNGNAAQTTRASKEERTYARSERVRLC